MQKELGVMRHNKRVVDVYKTVVDYRERGCADETGASSTER